MSDHQYFNDMVSFPRGYSNIANKQMYSWRSDYLVPVCSPDWNIWRLYYLKRVAMKLHYDFARLSALTMASGKVGIQEKRISSAGAELMTECHFFRFIAPVKIGVRESFLLEQKSFVSEFIISLNLRGM